MKEMDEKLKKRIVDQLYWDSRVDVSTVNIDVTGRKATITGTVPNVAASEVVLLTAWGTQGIIGVDNQLEVHYPDSQQPPPDKTIKDRIEQLIDWNDNLYGKEYELTAFLKENTSPERIKGRITVYTNNPEQKEIKIPVYCLVNTQILSED